MKHYLINEIFYSLQGEGYHAGQVTTFVRFSGCNLQCPFCDTRHHEGVRMSVDEIMEAVGRNPSRLVVITGESRVCTLTRRSYPHFMTPGNMWP